MAKVAKVDKTSKGKIIEQIYEHKDSDIVRLFIVLLDNLIEENREKNDTARVEEIPMNQGAIKQLRVVRDIFTKMPHYKK